MKNTEDKIAKLESDVEALKTQIDDLIKDLTNIFHGLAYDQGCMKSLSGKLESKYLKQIKTKHQSSQSVP